MGKEILSANQIFKNCFQGRKLSNTKVIKRGKISKTIAFEIARNNGVNGDYTKCIITIVDSETNQSLENDSIGLYTTYDNLELAEAAIILYKEEKNGK